MKCFILRKAIIALRCLIIWKARKSLKVLFLLLETSRENIFTSYGLPVLIKRINPILYELLCPPGRIFKLF